MTPRTLILISGIFLFLIAGTVLVFVLRRKNEESKKNGALRFDPSILEMFWSRIQAWWVFFGLLACALILGTVATTLFFFFLSFWALREYITLTPTKAADHGMLFLLYFIWTPLQFLLVGVNDEWFANVFGIGSYQVYSVMIPVYAFLILPAGIAISGDKERFLERVAKIQVGLMICVYSLSFAPAILTTTMHESADTTVTPAIFDGGVEDKVLAPISQIIEGVQNDAPNDETANAEESEPEKAKAETLHDLLHEKPMRKRMTSEHISLLFSFIFIVQMSDLFQYLWSQFFRRGVIAPKINQTKTWAGVLAGSLTTSLLSVALWYFIPLPKWWQPLIIGFVVSWMGFAGSITLSAIKRERDVPGYGHLVEGHNGILDRIDSLCFAAPVYFHLVWIFLHLEIRPF